MQIDLNEAEAAALLKELDALIENSRYPLSPPGPRLPPTDYAGGERPEPQTPIRITTALGDPGGLLPDPILHPNAPART